MNDPNQKSSADFGQWQNEQSPQKFNQMLSRGGGTAYKPQGITPPGPNHSPQWFNGPGQEFSKGGAPSGVGGSSYGWQSALSGMGGSGGGQLTGMGGPIHGITPGQQGISSQWADPASGYRSPGMESGPQGPYTPMGQMGPKGGPMGPWGGRGIGQPDPAPRGGEGGPSGPYNPMPPMDPKYPMGPQNPYFNTTGTYQLPPNPNRPMQAPFGGGEMSPMQRSLMARRPQQQPIGDPRFPDPGATLPIEGPIDHGPGLANQYGISPFQWRM